MSEDNRPPRRPDFGDRFDDEPERTIDESELRPIASYLQDIGPEDESIRVIEENLEEYGFDQMGEDVFESEVAALVEQPDWMGDEALERQNIEDQVDNDEGMYSDD
jgi:hypothetical protein